MTKLALATVILGLLATGAALAASPDVILLEGAVTSFGTVTSLGPPVATAERRTAFQAYLDPAALPEYSAVLGHGPGGLTLIARSGQVLPGGSQDLENLFNAGSTVPSLDAMGNVFFNAEVGPVGASNILDGLLRYDGSTGLLSPVVVDGDPAPDGFGQMYVTLLNRLAINTLGEVAFYAEILGATGGFGNGDGLLRRGSGAVTQIARTAQPMPGGGSIDGVSWPTLNDAGQVAFYATITGAPASAAGIFLGDGGPITKIARTGDGPVPGWIIRSFDPVGGLPINNSGWVAFRAQIDGTGPFDTVFRGNGTSTVLIAFAGQPVPGSTGTLRSMDRNVAINNQGQVAFIAGITDGSVVSGIFRGDGTTLTTIAREGDLVPGTAAGFFSDFRNDPFAINDRGELAFIANFQLGCCFQDGLFFYSDGGGLKRVVTAGEVLAGSTVTDFAFVGTSSGEVRAKSTGLDDDGRVAFRFSLADGRRGIAAYDGRALFQDGFESGNTAAWTVTVP